jgi:hypothetical protein
MAGLTDREIKRAKAAEKYIALAMEAGRTSGLNQQAASGGVGHTGLTATKS